MYGALTIRHCLRSWRSRGTFEKQNSCLLRERFTISISHHRIAPFRVHKAHPDIYAKGIHTDLWSCLCSLQVCCPVSPQLWISQFQDLSLFGSLSMPNTKPDHHDYSKPLQTSQAFTYYLMVLNDILVTHRENAIELVTYTVFLNFDSVFLNRLTKKKQIVKLRQNCDSLVFHPYFWSKEK